MAGSLRGSVALVTGASRGIGRGIALQLGNAGATVYITGRKPRDDSALSALEATAQEITGRGGRGIPVFCDHSSLDEVEQLFARIKKDTEGRLDILVNNAYSAVNLLMDTAGKKFYELEPSVWDDVNVVGLRNHYACCVHAARMMVPQGNGLIVTVSSPGGLTYLFNVAYGVGKAACDRLAADVAAELRKKNITSVSLWPGAVQTEIVKERVLNKDDSAPKLGSEDMFAKGETVEYSGKAIVALATDPQRHAKTGRILLTADLGDEYGFTDEGGRRPGNMRSLSSALEHGKWTKLAQWVPGWIKLPGWTLTAAVSKL